jgi:AAA domain, putative AbiEii toxin, Type IV TA system
MVFTASIVVVVSLCCKGCTGFNILRGIVGQGCWCPVNLPDPQYFTAGDLVVVYLDAGDVLWCSVISPSLQATAMLLLTGDPEVVYLDEPTTGMDPISRRFVWDIIEEAKPGRAIVLTTHSMEEVRAPLRTKLGFRV